MTTPWWMVTWNTVCVNGELHGDATPGNQNVISSFCRMEDGRTCARSACKIKKPEWHTDKKLPKVSKWPTTEPGNVDVCKRICWKWLTLATTGQVSVPCVKYQLLWTWEAPVQIALSLIAWIARFLHTKTTCNGCAPFATTENNKIHSIWNFTM